MHSASKWPPPRYAGRQVGFAHNPIVFIQLKKYTNLIDIPQTNYYQMILRIIWSNAQVIPLQGVWDWWCFAPPFPILGVLIRIFL